MWDIFVSVTKPGIEKFQYVSIGIFLLIIYIVCSGIYKDVIYAT